MGLLEICSYNSYWRGLDYFENDIDARKTLAKNKESFDRITPFHLTTFN